MEKLGINYFVLGFKRIFDFNGVSNRAEVYYFMFWGNAIGALIAFTLGYMSTLHIIVLLAMVIPNIALSIRRMHDVNKSGWNLLWSLTIIGVFYVVYLLFKQSSNSENDIGLGLSIVLYLLTTLLAQVGADDLSMYDVDDYSSSSSSSSSYSSCSDYDLTSVDWVYPNYSNASAAWKFNSGGDFNYSSTYFNTSRNGSWTRSGCNVTLYYYDTGERKTINISGDKFTIGSTTYRAY